MRHYTKNLKKRKITRKKNKRNRSKKRGGATSGGGAEMLVDATPSAAGGAEMQVDVTPSAAAGGASPPFPPGSGGAAPPFSPSAGGAAPPIPPGAAAADKRYITMNTALRDFLFKLQRDGRELKQTTIIFHLLALHAHGSESKKFFVKPGSHCIVNNVQGETVIRGAVPDDGYVVVSGVYCDPTQALECAFRRTESTSQNDETFAKLSGKSPYTANEFKIRHPTSTHKYQIGCSNNYGWRLWQDPPPPNRLITFGDSTPTVNRSFFGIFHKGAIVPFIKGTAMSADTILKKLNKNIETPQFSDLYQPMTAGKNIIKQLMNNSEQDERPRPLKLSLEQSLLCVKHDVNLKLQKTSIALGISEKNLVNYVILMLQTCRGSNNPPKRGNANNSSQGSVVATSNLLQGNARSNNAPNYFFVEIDSLVNSEFKMNERDIEREIEEQEVIFKNFDEPPLTPEPHDMLP